jgi:hypothetical protein
LSYYEKIRNFLNFAYTLLEEQLERRRTAVKARRPSFRLTSSAPAASAVAISETWKSQDRLSQDTGLPRLMQFLQNALTVPIDPARASTNGSEIPSLINLMDEEPSSHQKNNDGLASFSSLTPERSAEAPVRPSSLPATLSSSMADVRSVSGTNNTVRRSRDVLSDAVGSEYGEIPDEIYHRTGYGDMLQEQSGFDFEKENWSDVGSTNRGKAVETQQWDYTAREDNGEGPAYPPGSESTAHFADLHRAQWGS